MQAEASSAWCEARVIYPEEKILKAISDAYYEIAGNSSKHRGECGNFVTLRLAKLEFMKISRQMFSNFQIGDDSGDARKELGQTWVTILLIVRIHAVSWVVICAAK
jgi:hypothetical protein